ncbi:MAG: hypothetical protein GOMPHAMPRED_003337 [Gomphillus americanus]|uniref:Exonuclease domain-containing protein n=1 Tax=Gomphillus americanus TaxID=1940652 RepID=A0A8H3EI36_9LECA|nr:MAG: hypothetical protein GOMPHAMPRED_003337 [Gomphillus americanus]
MTGLNTESDKIMSLCCMITDANLNIYDDKGYEAIIHHDKETLDKMDAWCTKTHGHSGLTKACLESTTTAELAADQLLRYIKVFVPEHNSALLAGNSVHADKGFLSKPPYNHVLKHLHHRIFDVSTLKEAARRWASDSILAAVPQKQNLHQAREDILESIEEARYYRKVLFGEQETLAGGD